MSGKASFGEKAARRLEQAYGMDEFYLDSDNASNVENFHPVTLSKIQIPLISWVRAGSFSEINDSFQPGDADDWIVAEHTKPSKHSFALKVEGDSMTSTSTPVSFPDGCILIVDPHRAPKAGDYVVAKDTLNQRATFKQLTTDGASWYLKPLNHTYPTKEIDDPSLRVIGVVIEWQMGGKL